MSSKTKDAVNRHQFQRAMDGPDWRYRMAQELAVSGSSGRHGPADALTREAAEFLSLNGCSEMSVQADAAKRFRKISRAVALLADDTSASEVKILTLGGCPRSEIAVRLGVSEAVIESFELLFFDVREMKSHTSWVYRLVIRRESEAGAYDLAAKLRLAFCGGPDLARRILDAQIDVPVDEVDRIIGREMLLHAKLCAALDMPLTEEERIAFIEVVLDYEKHKTTLSFEKEKLVLQYSAAASADDGPAKDTQK